MVSASSWAMCRIGYVETLRAIVLEVGPSAPAVRRFRAEWPELEVVEVNPQLSESAAGLAVEEGLRTLDALHLASALLVAEDDLVLATWDRRLWRAAKRRRLGLLPERL